MPSDQGAQELHRESETLIRLGMLLRRSRSPEAQRAVERVLASSASSLEKVRRITEIDRESRHTEKPASPNRKRYMAAPETTNDRPTIRAHKIPRVGAPQTRQGLFAFVFRERFKIREFGLATRTIETGLLPTSVRLSPEVGAFLVGFARPAAHDVRVTLVQLMGNAWMHLTKHEYNHLVLVVDLCAAIDRLPSTANQYRSTRMESYIRPIRDRLLAVRYEPDSVHHVLDAIAKLISKNRRAIENLSALPGLVTRLISRTPANPSLIDVVIAVSMITYRRYLTEQDVVISGLESIIESDRFDCTAETGARIDEFLQKIGTTLDQLDRESAEILKVRTYLRSNVSGEVVIDPLRDFVATYKRQSWEKCAKNFAFLADAIVQPLTDVVASLFHRSVRLGSRGPMRLFTSRPFHSEIERMNRASRAIGGLIFDLPSLPRERMLALVDRKASATTFEAEFVMQIQIFQDALVGVRSTIESLIGLGACDEAGFEPVELHRALEEKTPLPLGAQVVSKEPTIGTQTLGDSLRLINKLSYLISYAFGDRAIRNLLVRENQIGKERATLRRVAQRVATKEQRVDILQHEAGVVSETPEPDAIDTETGGLGAE